jgi:hypothetical protein
LKILFPSAQCVSEKKRRKWGQQGLSQRLLPNWLRCDFNLLHSIIEMYSFFVFCTIGSKIMHEMDEKDELLGSTTPRHRTSRTFQFKIKRSLLAALVLISTCFLLVHICLFPFDYLIQSLTIPRSPNIILPNKHHHPAPSLNSKNAPSALFSQPASPSWTQHLLYPYRNSFKEGII